MYSNKNKWKKRYDKIILNSFSKVLKEDLSDSMTIKNHPKKTIKFLWRPNNYRRQIVVKTKSPIVLSTILKKGKVSNYKVTNSKITSIKNYNGITIQYGKNKLTAIYPQNIINGNKETYLLEYNTFQEIDNRLTDKRNEIKSKIDNAIYTFIKEFNIEEKGEKPKWSRYEDWIKGEDYIDKIPKETIIHDTYFKKVYGEGIEFKKVAKEEPITHLKNYIKNRAIEDLAPEIAHEINKLYSFAESLALYDKNIKKHLEVLENMDKTMNSMNKMMEESKKKGFLRRIFRL